MRRWMSSARRFRGDDVEVKESRVHDVLSELRKVLRVELWSPGHRGRRGPCSQNVELDLDVFAELTGRAAAVPAKGVRCCSPMRWRWSTGRPFNYQRSVAAFWRWADLSQLHAIWEHRVATAGLSRTGPVASPTTTGGGAWSRPSWATRRPVELGADRGADRGLRRFGHPRDRLPRLSRPTTGRWSTAGSPAPLMDAGADRLDLRLETSRTASRRGTVSRNTCRGLPPRPTRNGGQAGTCSAARHTRRLRPGWLAVGRSRRGGR